MAQINFTKQDGAWVGTFQVNGSFNLHIEVGDKFNYSVKQKTAGTLYALTDQNTREDGVLDNDYDGLVFPKDILVSIDAREIDTPTGYYKEA